MVTDTRQVVSKLNELAGTCRDAEEGFRTAANRVEDEHLRILFNNYCQQRAQLAVELQKEVTRLGATPETGPSVLGAIQRSWMQIRSAVGAEDDATILTECERAEDAAIERYEDALRSDLPANVRQIISRQMAAIKAARDRIRELENSQTA